MSELAVPENRLLIAGSWQSPASGEALPVLDPATQQAFHQAGRATAADVDAAVSAARTAYDGWSRMNPSDRGAILARWSQLIFQHVEELARYEAQDVGKPLSDARTNIFIAGSILGYFAGAADKLHGATLPSRSADNTGFTLREPLGVCAMVIAWNVPAILFMADAAPALAAGNTVVLKPSEYAPMSPLAIAALAAEAGLPPGVLNVVTGLGPEAGQPLTSHPGINHISFVGSSATGRAIMRSAAENLVPVKLELGGKSPNVVFADADLDAAVPAILESIVENAGQNCYAGSRLLIEEPIYDEVVQRLAAAMEAVKAGPWHEDLDMGPLVNGIQHERVSGFLSGGVAGGARVVTGGPGGTDGWFVKPTLFDKVTPDMPIVREEIFGPVLAAESFRGARDAIDRVNATPYGLLVSVWTNDLSRALRVTQEVRSGQVSVNEFANSAIIGFPFNLAKESGFSQGGGYEAMKEYTSEKGVTIKMRPLD
ncbi:aldehyde dehydrogenase family protein [Cryptosporangium sp. NPDC048952]|uniref:aldehyde dehydrogenase family protein n=1 Tax=Cryptosporangium sp. NPDC048952 TaxID=3363961 RepID=UPI003720B8E6